MLLQHKIVLCTLFLLFLTIILYGLAKAVIKMSFSELPEERKNDILLCVKKIDWTMYVPQIILLVMAFALGLFMPNVIESLINSTVIGIR